MADGRLVQVIVDVVAPSAARASNTVKSEVKKLADEVKQINAQTAASSKQTDRVIEEATKQRVSAELAEEKRLERERKKIADDFIRSVKQVNSEVESESKKGSTALNGFFGAFAGGFTGAAVFETIKTGISSVISGATAAAQSLFNFVRSASDYGSTIKDFQDKTGLAAATIQTLGFNAKQSGISLDQLAAPVAKFTRQFYDFQNGGEKATKTLEKFGVTRFDSLDDALGKVFAKVHAGATETEKTGLAMEAFGAKSGSVMRAVADNIDGNLSKAIARAKELGIVLSEEDVKAADDFGDTMSLLGTQAEVLGDKFALMLAPKVTGAMNSISQYLAKNQTEFQTWGTIAGGALNGIGLLAAVAASATMNALQAISDEIKEKTFGLINLAKIAQDIYNRYDLRSRKTTAAEVEAQNAETANKTAFRALGGKLPFGDSDYELPTGGGGGGTGGGKSKKPKTERFQMGSRAKALVDAAQILGVSPLDLGAIIGYETKGTFSPSIKGGKGGNYQGLIQFGKDERSTYGVTGKESFEDQMKAVIRYLQDRFKIVGRSTQGATLTDLYKAINGGNPNVGNVSDGNGRISDHVARIQSEQIPNALKTFFGGKLSNVPGGGSNQFAALKNDADKFLDTLREFTPALKQIGVTAEESLIQKLAKFLDQSDEKIKEFAAATGESVESLQTLAFAAANLENVKKGLDELTDDVEKFRTKGRQVADTVSEVQQLGGAIVEISGDFNQPTYKADTFFNVLSDRLNELKDTLPSFHTSLAENLISGMNGLADVFGQAAGAGKHFFSELKSGFTSLISSIVSDLARLAAQKFLTGILSKILGISLPGLGGSVAGGGSSGGVHGGIDIASSLVGGSGGSSSGGGLLSTALQTGGGLIGRVPAIASFLGLGAGTVLGGGVGTGGTAILTTMAGGAGVPAGGAGLLGSMGALFSNPWTAVAAGAAIGGFFLLKHFFGENAEKKLKKAAQSAYGVEIRDKNVLKQLKMIGEGAFGKGQAGKHADEVVQIETAKDIIEQYAEQTGQNTDKLGRNDYGNENWKGNKFGTKFNGFDSPSVSSMVRSSIGSTSSDVSLSGSSSGSANSELKAALNGIVKLLAINSESIDAFTEKFSGVAPADLLIAHSSTIGAAVLKEADMNQSFTDSFDRKTGRFV